MTVVAMSRVELAESVEHASSLLVELGEAAEVLAGGTWIMRARLRGERLKPVYVSLRAVADLRGIADTDRETHVGALVTHTQLAAAPQLRVLAEAAALSAFPQIRNVATVGGNLRALDFAQADLVPALLAAEATVAVHHAGGVERIPIGDYYATRRDRLHDEVVMGVAVPQVAGRSGTYERLTVRAGGEYAVAAVAVSIDRDPAGVVRGARIAVGSVEPQARLLDDAAALLVGKPLSPESGQAAGQAAANAVQPRDDIDAPAWYRKAVLPHLVERALGRLASEEA